MKINKLESEITTFRPVTFNDDFSIILGKPKSLIDGKSHNLGKTTLVYLIYDMLFGTGGSDRIKAIKANFDNPIFNLAIKTDNVITRNIIDFSKKRKAIFDKETKENYQYFIRFQDDYKDEFRKISIRGKDITWKPLLLKLMGFNERPLIDKYEVESSISDYDKFIKIASETSIANQNKKGDIDRLSNRKNEILIAINELDLFNIETSTINETSEYIDISISRIKRELFIKKKELATINDSLANSKFAALSEETLENLYKQINIYFGDQIKHDLREVNDFFNQITENRTTALRSIKKQMIDSISELEINLNSLNEKRTNHLNLIKKTESVELYKSLSNQLAETEKELSLLQQDIYKESIQTAVTERSHLKSEQLRYAADVASEIDMNDEKFKNIKSEYAAIMKEVMDIDSELLIEKNSTGNVEFKTISWKLGLMSEELKGEMAKKISCAAFDVALRIVNNSDAGFIIHDGVIDNADKNIKRKYITAIKSRAKKHNFQYILTAINDDLPETVSDDDIVITLSDINERQLLMGRSY